MFLTFVETRDVESIPFSSKVIKVPQISKLRGRCKQ